MQTALHSRYCNLWMSFVRILNEDLDCIVRIELKLQRTLREWNDKCWQCKMHKNKWLRLHFPKNKKIESSSCYLYSYEGNVYFCDRIRGRRLCCCDIVAILCWRFTLKKNYLVLKRNKLKNFVTLLLSMCQCVSRCWCGDIFVFFEACNLIVVIKILSKIKSLLIIINRIIIFHVDALPKNCWVLCNKNGMDW